MALVLAQRAGSELKFAFRTELQELQELQGKRGSQLDPELRAAADLELKDDLQSPAGWMVTLVLRLPRVTAQSPIARSWSTSWSQASARGRWVNFNPGHDRDVSWLAWDCGRRGRRWRRGSVIAGKRR